MPLPVMEIIDLARFRSGHHPSFHELFCQIGCAEPECNCPGQHDASPGYAESHDDDMLCNPELFQCHSACEDLEAPSGTGCDKSSRRQSGVDGGNQNRLGYKV